MAVTVKIDTRGLQALEKRLARMPHVQVGIFEGTHSESKLSMAQLFAIHEFGTARIPERSSLRRTFDDRKNVYALSVVLARIGYMMIERGMTHGQALRTIGTWGVDAVRKTILGGAGVPPPLSPITIARKGHSRALVDTHELVDALTYRTEE
jgi:hypothetical protein